MSWRARRICMNLTLAVIVALLTAHFVAQLDHLVERVDRLEAMVAEAR